MTVVYTLSLIVGFLMVSIGSFFSLWFLFLGLGLIIVSSIIMLVWHTKHCEWTCPRCGNAFHISMKENLCSINGGFNESKLTCPKCAYKGFMKGTIIK